MLNFFIDYIAPVLLTLAGIAVIVLLVVLTIKAIQDKLR